MDPPLCGSNSRIVSVHWLQLLDFSHPIGSQHSFGERGMKSPFFSRRSFTIMMVMMFLLPFVWAGTRRAIMSNQNDVKDWLPKDYPATKVHRWFNQHFPLEQFVLVCWTDDETGETGSTLDDPRVELLAQKLDPPKDGLDREGKAWLFKSVLTGPRLITELQTRYSSLTREQVLKRLEGSLIGTDHKHTAVLVVLSEAAKGNRQLHAALAKIRTMAEESNIKPENLRMGGPPVDNVAIDVEGERTLYRLAGLSAFIGLGISFACFRSVRLTAMIFWTAIIAAGVGLSLVYYMSFFFEWSTVDAIMLSMPSLVYVLAMSGAIHIINYYHDAIRESGLKAAPGQAIAHAWKPCTLAALTTAVGLGSLWISDLLPIAKFGLFSALGVLATLTLLFLMLPGLLHFFPSKEFAERFGGKGDAPDADTAIIRFWRKAGGWIIQHNLAVSGVCLVAMIGFAFGVSQIQTTVKLVKMFSPEAEVITYYEWIEDHFGPLVPMEVVLRIDNDKCKMNMVQRMRLARTVERVVETMGDPSRPGDTFSALSAASLAPSLGTQKLDYNTRDSILSKRLEGHRDQLKDYLQIDEENGEELWRISARVWALTDMDYATFVDELKKKVEPVLDHYRDDLGVEGISATYTGLVPLIYQIQHELMKGLFESLALAFVLIAVVMMLVLRSPSAGLLSMVPNLFPVVMIFGIMGWLGILVDVGSMMTASVALGVAVDDTIHYLTWFRDGLDRGKDRKGAAMWAYEKCATAMTQTTLIAGLGLAAFAFSTFTPTQRFGVLMLTLLTAALLGDLIFLPALLTGPIGRFFDRQRKCGGGPSDPPSGGSTILPASDESALARFGPHETFSGYTAPRVQIRPSHRE